MKRRINGYQQRLRTLKERFEEKYSVADNDCWIFHWRTDWNGYGKFFFQGRERQAHAVSKYLYEGVPLDSNARAGGMVWDHLCRNHSCVNPKHLELVTARENTIRGVGIVAINASKTHCKWGHDLSIHGIDRKAKGKIYKGRSCNACYTAHNRRRLAKLKAARQTLKESTIL